MPLTISAYDRQGAVQYVKNKRQLRKAVAYLVNDIGDEEFMRPDLEHYDCWLTDGDENTITVDVYGRITLNRTNHPKEYLYDLPYSELETLLLAFGEGDWDTIADYNWSPTSRRPDRPRYLHAANTGFSDLHRAASLGDLEWAQSELASGANVNAACDEGATALHWASATGQLDLCQFLIESGADINACTCVGSTPLDYAGGSHESDVKGRKKTEKFLKKHGARTGDDAA